MGLGFPILIIWVIAMPILALVLLIRAYKSDTEEQGQKVYFLILTQGLKSNRFYWEFINTLRKVIILMSLVFPNISLKLFCSSIILLVTWRLQNYLEPYKNHENNKLEMFGVIAGIITLCSGLVYVQDETTSVPVLDIIVLMIVICTNLKFLLEWCLHLTHCLSSKNKL